ncbi:MAG: activator of ATPase 1 family protein [Thermomicrobiales bacterium]|nr:activator of ATPase 1 family protein [Thermomicrobiales bacterium]
MIEKTSGATTFTTPSDREIRMTRVFNAPRELVFQAHIDPQHVPHWWGQRRSTTIVDVMDVRPGGAWRFVQRDPEGNEYGFRGEYREVVPPERLVYTFEYEGMPGHILVETVTFEEHDGKTMVSSTALFDSVEDRDGMLESGMESGAIESWDRLEEGMLRRSRPLDAHCPGVSCRFRTEPIDYHVSRPEVMTREAGEVTAGCFFRGQMPTPGCAWKLTSLPRTKGSRI